MSVESRKIGEDLFAEVSKAADELYFIRDTYFPANPKEKESNFLLNQISHSSCSTKFLKETDFYARNSFAYEKRKLPLQRASYEYLRGKLLDVFPKHNKEAEDHLSKAVKLNPSLVDAWLSLGNCVWKKGDLASARNCFMLGLSKGPNKGILRDLSILERRMSQDEEDKVKIVDESIKHAKEAIALDLEDGNSWYTLGNACLTSFFVTGAWDHGKLRQSLKAYQLAIRGKDERMLSNPDLYCNCATVNNYLENYERALSGFEATALRDPALNAMEEVQKIVHLLDKIDSFLHTKVKRLASLTSSLAKVNVNAAYRKETIDCLSEGVNKSVAVVGKVLFFVMNQYATPLYYVLCDSSQTCYIISVYKIQREAIKEGDQVTLLDPCYRYVDFAWKGKRYQFRSVRVDFKEQLLVNGKTVSPELALPTTIYAHNKT